ncbi:MAG: NAD-dependent epimerase/dehydratase family protein [Chloroflexota bacterium]
MSTGERFLVTGALGFVGAWTVRALVREGVPVVAFDLGTDRRRLASIMTEDEIANVVFEAGDITDSTTVDRVIDANDITNVVHLAALQVPFCRGDPPLGARVNVVGTINVFEAVRRRRDVMAPVVYTSSIAVFAGDDTDPATGRLLATATGHPVNHYGVFKMANEGNARVYWLDNGVASVGVRPMTVYGVGRDQGMTSGPTKAIAAAVLGQPYRVSFRGPTLYQYAEDVARTLIAASRAGLDGARVFNLAGAVADDRDLVDAIRAVVPGAEDLITFDSATLPFPSEIDHDGLDAIGPVLVTPFAEGVRSTAEIFRDLASDGRLRPEDHGLEPLVAAH